MKKLLVILSAIAMVSAVSAQAGTVRDNCGCGLGSMALGDEEGLLSNVVGATLNGLSGNQTFGISSGTLGCDQSTEITSNQKIQKYVTENMDQLAMDMASGEGHYLSALTGMMNLSEVERVSLQETLQTNFDLVFTSPEVSAEEVVLNITQFI